MMNLKGKKLILCILSLILCFTACAPAFASTGDRVLLRQKDGAEENFYIRKVFPYGDGGFSVFIEKYPEEIVLRYTDYQAEPEKFVRTAYEQDTHNFWLDGLNGEENQEEETDDFSFADDAPEAQESRGSEYVYDYFSWNSEIYALMNRYSDDGETYKEEILVKHVKLEDGQIILEEENVPKLDFSSMIDSDTGSVTFYGANNMLAVGDKLFMNYYAEEGQKLLAFDLNSGDCTECDFEEVSEITAGPEGSLLFTRAQWSEDEKDYDSVTIRISKLNPETLAEEPLTEMKIKGNSQITPCYDEKTDTLYYVSGGELWAMPQCDAAKAVAVNDCPETGNGMLMLKDGFVLVELFSSLVVKNTDPAQRGSIQLRVKGGGYNTITNAIYDLNNERGDISVISESDWTFQNDLLQSMMNHDSHTDVYLLTYLSNEFNALYNRGYLIDLSSNETIAANTARMYPYIQDAVKKDGKIVAVPVYAYGGVLGFNVDAMKMLGLKEEDLPHTWSQFFDLMEKLPEMMEDVQVKISWEDRVYLRSMILESILEHYELWREKKGDKEYAFNNPILCDLVSRLNNLDYTGLKAREYVEYDPENEDGYDYGDDDDNMALMESYISTTMNGDAGFIPLFLSFTEDEEPVIPVELEVAFVNPYSEHPQEAMEFLGYLTNAVDLGDQYTFYTDKTEPIRNPNEDSLTMIDEAIEAYKAKIAESEGEQKVELEERLKNLEESREEMDRYSWRISPVVIERYQKNKDLMKVRGYSFYNVLFGQDDNNGDEDKPSTYETIFTREESAQQTPEELLGMLDSMVQMIRLEGN